MNQFVCESRRDADRQVRRLIDEVGGSWVAEKHLKTWVARQTATKAQLDHAIAVKSAQWALNPECDWWDNSPWSGYSYFKSRAEETIAKFATDFAFDPHHALRWGTDTVEAAATLSVLKVARREHDRGVTDQAIIDELTRKVEREASLSCSTSPMRNLTKQAELIACAKIASALRSSIEHRHQAILTISSDETYS